MTRANKFVASTKQIEFYSDFLPDMDLNPITEQLAMATNENAVAQALKGLVLTNNGERFYHPEIGSKVQSLNFEPDDQSTMDLLKMTITNTLNQCEPRAKLQGVQVQADPGHNAVYIQVIYSLINIPGVFTSNFPLRVR
jgi:phage baseplate assembly protein W